MIKIILTILLLSIPNSALATSLDDLKKIQKKILDLNNSTLEDDNNISDLDNLTLEDDNNISDLDNSTLEVGCIKGDCTNGQGTYTFISGNMYVGQFKDSKYHGRGTYTFTNGNMYVGEWKDSKYHGNGYIIYADGIVDEGIWANGKLIKKKIQISDLTLFGVKLGDDVSKYKLSQKYFKPNIKNSYCWYSSTEEGLRNGVDYDRCIDLDLFTIGGNNRQSRHESVKGKLNPYFSLNGIMDGLTFLHSSDHRFFTPQNPNSDFDNYLIKFDPNTKKIIGIFAREKKSIKLDKCEDSKYISSRAASLQLYPYKRWYSDKVIKQGFRILYPDSLATVKITWEDLLRPIAGFGFTCEETGLISYHRWIYLVNFLDSEEYWQNIHTMIDQSLKKENKKKDQEILDSEKFKGL